MSSKKAYAIDYRSGKSYKSKKALKKGKFERVGYSTVARTRGVYAKGEMKYFDTRLDSGALPASADWTATEFDPTATVEGTPVATPLTLFAPVTGSAINQRIGREVKVHKIKVRLALASPAQGTQAAADSAANCRIILVQDMQTNSAQMQGEQLMTSTANVQSNVLSFQSLNNFGRFKVLKDKFVTIQNPATANDTGATGGLVQQGLIKTFKFSINFKKPVPVRFNATNGGTIADIVDNSFHILANCTATALAPTLFYSARVAYKE